MDDIIDAIHMNLGKHQEMVRDKEAWCAEVHEVTKSWTMAGKLNSNNNKSSIGYSNNTQGFKSKAIKFN